MTVSEYHNQGQAWLARPQSYHYRNARLADFRAIRITEQRNSNTNEREQRNQTCMWPEVTAVPPLILPCGALILQRSYANDKEVHSYHARNLSSLPMFTRSRLLRMTCAAHAYHLQTPDSNVLKIVTMTSSTGNLLQSARSFRKQSISSWPTFPQTLWVSNPAAACPLACTCHRQLGVA